MVGVAMLSLLPWLPLTDREEIRMLWVPYHVRSKAERWQHGQSFAQDPAGARPHSRAVHAVRAITAAVQQVLGTNGILDA